MTNTKSNKTRFVIPIIILAVFICFVVSVLLSPPFVSSNVNEDTGKDIEILFPTDGSNPYLAVPVTIVIKNISGIVQPVSQVNIKIDGNWIDSWNKVYETNGNRMFLPKNIEPNASLGFLLIIPIPLKPKLAQDIRDIYRLSPNTLTAKLGTINDYKIKTSQVQYSQRQTLYHSSQRYVEVYFTFMTVTGIADDLNTDIEPILLP